jgi:hypothetical protein
MHHYNSATLAYAECACASNRAMHGQLVNEDKGTALAIAWKD